MKSLFLVLSSSFCLFLNGAVFDHIQPVRDKEPICRFENIDFLYLINLDHRPEKLLHCKEQLSPYAIYPHRFSAVYGWDLPLQTIHDVGYRINGKGIKKKALVFLEKNGGEPSTEWMKNNEHTYFSIGMTKGAIGIILSHLSVIKDAYDSGYETVWVMEDDIMVHQDPDLLPILIDKLDALVGKKGWDLLYTDRNSRRAGGGFFLISKYCWRPDCKPQNDKKAKLCREVGDDFLEIGIRYGTYSYLLRRSGMKKILDFYTKHPMYNAIDVDIFLAKNLKIFTVIEDVVSNDPNAVTDNIHSTGW